MSIVLFQRKKIIHSAKIKVQKLNPIIVGITGGDEKKSTKEFLHSILSQKFATLVTPQYVNTEIDIAQIVLHDLQLEHEIFIVEMEAHKKDEIQALCKITPPIIGVLTGSEQTAVELLEALPSSGAAIINKDDSLCTTIANKTSSLIQFYSIKDTAHIYASHIYIAPFEIQFQLHIKDQTANVRCALYGSQVIPSILAAATVAHHLGLSLSEIVAGIEKLQPLPAMMLMRQGKNHSVIIDDQHNTNVHNFIAAIEYLSVWKKRKIVITSGRIALEKAADSPHQFIGSCIGKNADMLIITAKDFAEPLQIAAKQAGLTENYIHVEHRPQRLIRRILSTVGENDVVLIEGRVHQKITRYLVTVTK